MVVVVDVQLLGQGRANMMGSVVHLALQLSLEGRGGTGEMILSGLLIHELVSQALNLVVGILKKLSKLGNSQLKVGIVLEEVSDKMADNFVVLAVALEGAGSSSTFEAAGGSIKLLLDLALALDALYNVGMAFALLSGVGFQAFQVVLHIGEATLGVLGAQSMGAGIFSSRTKLLMQAVLLLLEQGKMALGIGSAGGGALKTADGLVGGEQVGLEQPDF